MSKLIDQMMTLVAPTAPQYHRMPKTSRIVKTVSSETKKQAASPERVRRLEVRVKELEAQLKAAQSELSKKKATSAALLAQANAMKNALKAVDPGSRLLGPTKEVWRSGVLAGQPKTGLRLIWERAFDATAKELGVENPLSMRQS